MGHVHLYYVCVNSCMCAFLFACMFMFIRVCVLRHVCLVWSACVLVDVCIYVDDNSCMHMCLHVLLRVSVCIRHVWMHTHLFTYDTTKDSTYGSSKFGARSKLAALMHLWGEEYTRVVRSNNLKGNISLKLVLMWVGAYVYECAYVRVLCAFLCICGARVCMCVHIGTRVHVYLYLHVKRFMYGNAHMNVSRHSSCIRWTIIPNVTASSWLKHVQ
jgi:hypothetical protein